MITHVAHRLKREACGLTALAALVSGASIVNCSSSHDDAKGICTTCTGSDNPGGSGYGGHGYGAYGYGYSYGASHGIQAALALQHHPFLVPDHGAAIAFTWREAAGREAPVDLSLFAGSELLLQVFSQGAHPFARAGLEAITLEAGEQYRVVLERTGSGAVASILRERDGAALLRAAPAPLDAEQLADVVLPGRFWRANIVGARPGE